MISKNKVSIHNIISKIDITTSINIFALSPLNINGYQFYAQFDFLHISICQLRQDMESIRINTRKKIHVIGHTNV